MEKHKIKNICDFYVITHKLKNLLRTGWVKWKVNSNRIESVAEHIYGTQMLAFIINSEFELGLDIEKVILMLAMHELGETIVGDISAVEIMDNTKSKEEKHTIEMKAVLEILAPLNNQNKIIEIFEEFEDNKTNEAIFAHRIDKLEANFQCKYYEESGCNDFTIQQEGIYEKIRLDGLSKGYKTLAKTWISYDKEHYNFNELFIQIMKFLDDNNIYN